MFATYTAAAQGQTLFVGFADQHTHQHMLASQRGEAAGQVEAVAPALHGPYYLIRSHAICLFQQPVCAGAICGCSAVL
jgi:hypothetical protein